MSLPEFDDLGDLPVGIHSATIGEVTQRFGDGSGLRERATNTLKAIYDLAIGTGKLDRLIIFGSYVTTKSDPRDIDVVLVMADDFVPASCDDRTRVLFDHKRADGELGASVFWLTPGVLLRGTVDDFLLKWGTKRDLTMRGIVEVIP